MNQEDPDKLYDTGSSGLSFLRKSGKYDEILVEKRSLDFIVDKYKISPRFIKVDIEGNGLGLAIVKSIIEQHGGHITVESVVGQGSCFSFILKLDPDSIPKEMV